MGSAMVPLYRAFVSSYRLFVLCSNHSAICNGFQLKISTPLTLVVKNVYANFVFFFTFLCFRVTSPYGTDGQTDKTRKAAYRTAA